MWFTWLLDALAEGPAAAPPHRFDDVDRWVAAFDDPARDAWQKPAELVKGLGLEPGQTVADIGAGTGYLVPHLAAAVGPEGHVIAVDVEATLAAHMAKRFRYEQLGQVEVRLGRPDDPALWGNEADWIVLLDTYHHISDREAYFGRLREVAIARKGRLVIVDFVAERELPVGPPPEHRLGEEQVRDELRAAGWRFERALDVLPYQYVLVFKR